MSTAPAHLLSTALPPTKSTFHTHCSLLTLHTPRESSLMHLPSPSVCNALLVCSQSPTAVWALITLDNNPHLSAPLTRQALGEPGLDLQCSSGPPALRLATV